MDVIEEGLDRAADECGFSGAVRLDRGGEVVLSRAFGLAERGLAVPNTVDTQFAVASATKGITALTLVSLEAVPIRRLERFNTALTREFTTAIVRCVLSRAE